MLLVFLFLTIILIYNKKIFYKISIKKDKILIKKISTHILCKNEKRNGK